MAGNILNPDAADAARLASLDRDELLHEVERRMLDVERRIGEALLEWEQYRADPALARALAEAARRETP